MNKVKDFLVIGALKRNYGLRLFLYFRQQHGRLIMRRGSC